MANNIEIKKILEDIIEYTYKDKVSYNILKKMKKFYIKLENKITKSYHGCYKYDDASIIITNLYRPQTNIVCTTIHELAHHVDFILRGKSDHSKDFYAVFAQLLYTGLNMGLFKRYDALNMETDASDGNKIKKIIERYKSNPIQYKQNYKTIIVSDGYKEKETLKEFGFKYNNLTNTWEITISNIDLHDVESKLKTLNCSYHTADAGKMNIDATGYLVATTGSFAEKDTLKENGFFWDDKKKIWKKKILMSNYKDEMQKLKILRKKVKIILEKSK